MAQLAKTTEIELTPEEKLKLKEEKERIKDELLFHKLPEVYNKYKNDPIDEKKIIFLELRQTGLTNSSRFLYDILKSQYNFKIHIHLLRTNEVEQEEYEDRCKRFMKDLATAKYVFLCEASEVLSCIEKRPETIITQLWHGCGAFKKFGMSTAATLFGPDAEGLRRHPNNKNYNHVMISSPEVAWAYAEAMDLIGEEDKIKALGISRTDYFFQQNVIDTAYRRLYEVFPAAKGKKIILFAPTFRGSVARAETAVRFSEEAFAYALGDEYVIITKHHPHAKNVAKINEEINGIYAFDCTDAMSIEDLLCVADICISDYSSLIFEYSLFERPMIFYAYDLENYFDWRGFYYPYDELTPGPVIRTNKEMIEYIKNIDETFDREKVIRFRERFMSACDGHATERIMDLVFGKEVLAQNKKE